MKYSYLQNFRALDSESFAALMRHLGFVSAVCYRVGGETLVQVLAMESSVESSVESSAGPSGWPAAASFSYHHTGPGAVDGTPPVGWVKPSALSTPRKLWPKGTTFYFPDQELFDDKIVFAVLNATGKRSKGGELFGPLEAAAGRVRGWLRDQGERQALSEAGIREHLQRLGVDLRMLIDHELRTPMASVSGYLSLLSDVNPAEQPEVWRDFFRIVETETANALEAIDKLSLALYSEQSFEAPATEIFDAAEDLKQLCEQAKDRAAELIGEDAGRRAHLKFQKATDQPCLIDADRSLFGWALWEVLKNAVTHSRSGKVGVAVYTSDKMLVIDIEDDGSGVSPGSEELIFLRFYQDPGTQHLRRGKRGLGLGLFLARHIVERHLGRLTFIRQRGTSLFRFVWPLPKDETTTLQLPRGA